MPAFASQAGEPNKRVYNDQIHKYTSGNKLLAKIIKTVQNGIKTVETVNRHAFRCLALKLMLPLQVNEHHNLDTGLILLQLTSLTS